MRTLGGNWLPSALRSVLGSQYPCEFITNFLLTPVVTAHFVFQHPDVAPRLIVAQFRSLRLGTGVHDGYIFDVGCSRVGGSGVMVSNCLGNPYKSS